MVTCRNGPARRERHRSTAIRVFLIVLGLVLGFVGLAAWSLETEYGGDPDRQEYVIAQEAGQLVQVLGESGNTVFEGTQQEVDAWLEEERGSRNYIGPILLYAAAAFALLAGIAPERNRTS